MSFMESVSFKVTKELNIEMNAIYFDKKKKSNSKLIQLQCNQNYQNFTCKFKTIKIHKKNQRLGSSLF